MIEGFPGLIHFAKQEQQQNNNITELPVLNQHGLFAFRENERGTEK
jgi:hypothetical protein